MSEPTRLITIRATTDYHAWLVGLAEAEGETVAELVERLLAARAKHRKHPAPPPRTTPPGWDRTAMATRQG